MSQTQFVQLGIATVAMIRSVKAATRNHKSDDMKTWTWAAWRRFLYSAKNCLASEIRK